MSRDRAGGGHGRGAARKGVCWRCLAVGDQDNSWWHDTSSWPDCSMRWRGIRKGGGRGRGAGVPAQVYGRWGVGWRRRTKKCHLLWKLIGKEKEDMGPWRYEGALDEQSPWQCRGQLHERNGGIRTHVKSNGGENTIQSLTDKRHFLNFGVRSTSSVWLLEKIVVLLEPACWEYFWKMRFIPCFRIFWKYFPKQK